MIIESAPKCAFLANSGCPTHPHRLFELPSKITLRNLHSSELTRCIAAWKTQAEGARALGWTQSSEQVASSSEINPKHIALFWQGHHQR